MTEFTLRLAGLAIGVTALYPEALRQCAAYLCNADPDFHLAVTPRDIDAERANADREAAFEGLPPPHFTVAELQSTALYRKIAERLPAYGAWVFHGSAVMVDGAAYLFTAKSGTGKSTHTRLWRQLLGEQAVMLNDDKPILRVDDAGKAWVYGTPWDGKHHLSTNTAAPLAGLAELQRGAENQLERVSAAEIWPMLLQQSYRSANALALQQTMQLVDKLTAAVPLYRLTCNMTLQAAQVAYAGMRSNTKGTCNEAEI